MVHDTVLKSGWDTVLVAVPFVAVLFVVFFRLDQIFVPPKRGGGLRRPASGIDEHGRMLLSDPDGRPWHPERDPK